MEEGIWRQKICSSNGEKDMSAVLKGNTLTGEK